MSDEQMTSVISALQTTKNIRTEEIAKLIQAMDKASENHPETVMILKAICAGIHLTSEGTI